MVKNTVDYQKLNQPTAFGLPWEYNFYSFHLSATKEISEKFKQLRPNCIYQRLCLGNFSGAVLSNKFKIPLILEYNGSEVWISKNWGK